MKGVKINFSSIDEYIANSPAGVRKTLKELRATIKAAAPGAEEKIGYMMPAFALKGPLVYFAAFKDHIGFFPTSSGVASFKKELSAYVLDGDEIVGIGNSVPLNWQKPFTELPDSGLDWAMEKANADFKSRARANLLVGIEILINEKCRGRGVSFRMLEIMKGIAKTNGIAHVALPLRPTLKSHYPLIPIADYVGWRNPDGLPFDPWLRVHIKAGGEIVGICERSMEISGFVSDWEKWTGLEFPGSGDFIVAGALVPVSIDKGNKTGKYFEPNVWVVHKTI